MSLFTNPEKTTAIFPRTKIKAVSADDGTGLDAIIADLNNSLNGKMANTTVPINKGGTGAVNARAAQQNLLAGGMTVLSSNQYGTTLPAAGTPGRIFFKKV